MSNITDIRDRLPPPKFKSRIVDSSRVESYEQAPQEYQISALRGVIMEAAKQINRLVGEERMFYELSDISVAAAKAVRAE